MRLQTTRLHIRELHPADLYPIHQLNSLAETDRYNTLGVPAGIEVTQGLVGNYLLQQHAQPRTSYVFCIEPADTGEFAGMIALNLSQAKYRAGEVWYNLHKDYWGRGYATEALRALLAFGFEELKLHRITAGCAVGNIASKKVLEKCGMQPEGIKRKNLPIRGEWIDSCSYAILDEDFAMKH